MSEGNAELRAFLRTRRARLTPEQAGLPVQPGIRRVPGLRREEVARLAGVSTDYYIRLERGRNLNVSESVLKALARALQLNETERTHLLALANLRRSPSRHRVMSTQRVRPGLLQTLNALTDVPALVIGRRCDVLATNALARALYTDSTHCPAASAILSGSSSSTMRHDGSTSTGRKRLAVASPACTSTPGEIRTTPSSPSWSTSCPYVTRISAAGGPTTTCTGTATVPTASTTRSPAR